MDFINWKEIPPLIYVIALATFGGIVQSIDEQRKDGKTVPLWKRFFSMVLNGITSGFAGTLTYFLYYSMSNSTEPSMFLFFLAGVSGWLGGGSIKFFVAIWKAFLHTQEKGGGK